MERYLARVAFLVQGVHLQEKTKRYKREEERLTLSQEEARELVKFERETEIINQINIEKSFEENRNLFKLIKESRFTRVGLSLIHI